jgi:hypothetical protein
MDVSPICHSDYVDISYQYVRRLHTRCTTVYRSVCGHDYKITCNTGTWINFYFTVTSCFLISILLSNVQRTFLTESCGGSALITVHYSVASFKCYYDLEHTEE